MKSFTLVYYVFQHQQSNEYNICKIKSDPTVPEIKVKHVIKAFPFNALSGEYHFRFKSEFKQSNQNVTGWIDIINVNSKVPIFNNSIYVKILKLKNPLHNKILTAQKLQKIRDPTPEKRTPSSVSPQPVPSIPIKTSNVSSAKNLNSVNIFDIDEPTSPIKKEIQINETVQQNNGQMFFSNLKPVEKQTDQLKPKIEQDSTEQKLKRARQNWEKTQTKQLAQQQAARQLDEKIQKWAYSMKQRNNFRTLLVTVHEIWPYGKWEPIDLGKLLTDNQLKKYYKKAMLAFHPDKNENKDEPKQLYLAKRVFSQINAAFNAQVK